MERPSMSDYILPHSTFFRLQKHSTHSALPSGCETDVFQNSGDNGVGRASHVCVVRAQTKRGAVGISRKKKTLKGWNGGLHPRLIGCHEIIFHVWVFFVFAFDFCQA